MFFLVDYIMIICEYIWVWSWWTCLYEIIDVCLFYLKMYTNKNIWSFTIMYGCVWLRIFCRFTSRKATPHLLGTSNRDVNGDTYNREKFWLWLVQGIQYMFPSLKFAYFFSSASFSPCVPVLAPATRRFRKNRWDFRLPVWSLVTPGDPHGDGKGMPEGRHCVSTGHQVFDESGNKSCPRSTSSIESQKWSHWHKLPEMAAQPPENLRK